MPPEDNEVVVFLATMAPGAVRKSSKVDGLLAGQSHSAAVSAFLASAET